MNVKTITENITALTIDAKKDALIFHVDGKEFTHKDIETLQKVVKKLNINFLILPKNIDVSVLTLIQGDME